MAGGRIFGRRSTPRCQERCPAWLPAGRSWRYRQNNKICRQRQFETAAKGIAVPAAITGLSRLKISVNPANPPGQSQHPVLRLLLPLLNPSPRKELLSGTGNNGDT